ncbi:MAG: DUF4397 domain-containing protein [Myxococcales bacterium FL481]|nr:MAG: DUF4397 domain-containing protein [Myxococcales bacterium FL481]
MGDDDDAMGDDDDDAAGDANIRVMHLGVGVPAVDVFVNEQAPAAITDLDFRETTAYVALPEASYSFQVALAGGSVQDAAITTDALPLSANAQYTAVAVGDLEQGNLEILALGDDTTDLPADSIRVRVVHAAPAVGQVDIWNVTDPENPAPLFEDVDFAASGVADLPPSSYDIGIDVDNDAVPDLTFTADLSGIAAGSVVNVYANNDAADEPEVSLVAQLPDNTVAVIPANAEEDDEEANIRVLHLGVGVPEVDVFVNEQEPAAITDLGFRAGTDYVALPADEHVFSVSLAGGTPADAAITTDPIALAAGANYTAAAIGDLETGNLEILPLADDVTDLDDENIRIQVVHAAPAVGQVDIWNVTAGSDPAPLLEDVDYGAHATLDVPPASYDLGIDVDDDAAPDLVFTADLSGIAPGSIVNVFANNDAEETPEVSLIAQLPDSTIAVISANAAASDAHIRVVHLGVGVPEVDVFVDDQEPAAITDLDFREGTDYVALPAEEHTFAVSLAGGTPEDAAISTDPIALAEGASYTAAAIGDLEAGNLSILALSDDVSDLDDELLRLQVVHAAPAVGQVDIWNVTEGSDPAPLLEDVDYGAHATLDVPPASYDLGIDVDNDASPDLVFIADLSGVEPGSIVNVFANNDDADPMGVVLVAQLPDSSLGVIEAE